MIDMMMQRDLWDDPYEQTRLTGNVTMKVSNVYQQDDQMFVTMNSPVTGDWMTLRGDINPAVKSGTNLLVTSLPVGQTSLLSPQGIILYDAGGTAYRVYMY